MTDTNEGATRRSPGGPAVASRTLSRFGRALPAFLAFAALAPASAAAAEVSTLTAGEAVERDCAELLLPEGTPGTAHSTFPVESLGVLTAQLSGGDAPDWDLALFEEGEVVAASTSFTSDERASTFAEAGDEIVIQACRIEGGQSSVQLETDPFPIDRAAARQDLRQADPITLESVELDEAAGLARLERTGLDVTHDVSETTATVVAYSDAERRLLDERGFAATTAVPDLAAVDAADRAAEEAAAAAPGASTLPSTRETYRSYSEFTTELKGLADANPALVRSVEIGTSYEGRPIEGVEIAVGVNRTDDGRPVYLNFGGHHAREWPASELPMEFAIDLVERYDAGEPRVVSLLQDVRVVIVPVVNPDGYTASRDAPGNGPNPAIDDDADATLVASLTGEGAYRRKNCHLTTPGAPCAYATGQGVDLNRNYGAYWGGPGSSDNPGTQNYRGTAPFSEPESQAVHEYSASVHPTVYITNHTFTDGRWLRQPGFDAPFLPQALIPSYDDGCPANEGDDMGAISPDEPAMKALGDAMAAANGYISELGYETLCDITGASEDWNYFSQGTYGYTPELRGTNFHGNYATAVVAEYAGTRDSYLVAGEEAADESEHGVIEGSVPPGATLKLKKDFETPTCEDAVCEQGNGPSFDDGIETELIGPASGSYEWHVNPSGRPLHPGETYTMSCKAEGQRKVTREVSVERGARITENWASECAAAPPVDPPDPPRCGGKLATIVGTRGDDRLRGTDGVDVLIARGGDDVIRARGGDDRVCARGGADRIRGGGGDDRLRAGADDDKVGGGADDDWINGGRGTDRCRGGAGENRLRAC